MRLANERTLELNITHQLLIQYRDSYAVASTLQAEAETGIDSAIRTPYRIILFQYKAADAHKGDDAIEGHFRINNNSLKDQHVKLHAIASVFTNTVFYAFPLVRTDTFFELNAANLIPYTKFIPIEYFPSYSEGESHRVQVDDTGRFIATSRKFEGKGFTGEEFLNKLKEGELGHEVTPDKQSIKQFMEKLEGVCREAEYQRRNIRLAFFHPTEPFLYSFRFGKRSKFKLDRRQMRLG